VTRHHSTPVCIAWVHRTVGGRPQRMQRMRPCHKLFLLLLLWTTRRNHTSAVRLRKVCGTSAPADEVISTGICLAGPTAGKPGFFAC
jgi:hypothetical protein